MVFENILNHYIINWNKRKQNEEQQIKSDITSFDVKELEAFLNIMEDQIVKNFLNVDMCYTLADNYLIAMAFVYLKRAGIPISEYNRYNFFLALYLTHDMEEDEEDEKLSIFPWLLGKNHTRRDLETFHIRKYKLWKAMDFRANVSLSCCKKVMELIPDSEVWKRKRDPAHGGALRPYSNKPTCLQCVWLCRADSSSTYSCSICDDYPQEDSDDCRSETSSEFSMNWLYRQSCSSDEEDCSIPLKKHKTVFEE